MDGLKETRRCAGFFVFDRRTSERLAVGLFERHTRHEMMRFAMTPETEGKEEKGSSGLPPINDPGNEDPGSLMDDATVPLNDSDEADMEYEEDEDEDEDEQ
jgi:hypothetical protein